MTTSAQASAKHPYSWPAPVPAGWSLGPIKRFIARMDSGVSVNAMDLPAEPGLPGVLKTSCVYTGEFDPRENKAVVPEERHLVACPVQAGALIVSRMNTPDLVGSAGVVREPAPDLYLPDRLWQITFDGLDPHFAHYWTQSVLYRAQVQAACAGTSASMQNLSQEDLRQFVIAAPPLQQQKLMVVRLDHVTKRIDSLIRQKEKFLDLLQERRVTLTSMALTGGLDSIAERLNSGLPWFGEVPNHWSMTRLGRHVRILNGFAFPSDGFSTREEDCRLLRGINIGVSEIRWTDCVRWPRSESDGLDWLELQVADVVVGLDRTWVSAGTRVATVTDRDVPCLLLQRVAALRCLPSVMPEYVFHLLASGMFKSALFADQTGLSVPHISSEQIARFEIALPPLGEQRRICEYLAEVTARIDALKACTERSIELLHERRGALIAAVVTGQLETPPGQSAHSNEGASLQ